ESRLLSLEESITVIDSLIREEIRLSQSIRALIGTQAQENRDNIALLSARQEEITYQLMKLLQKLQDIQLYGGVETPTPQQQPVQITPISPPSSSPPVTSPVASGDSLKTNPKTLYDSAMDDIQNGSFLLAESRFLSFLMQFPDHELAGNAQYWLGEAAYGQKKFDLAIKEFEKVLKKYPKSPKVRAALLKIGFSQLETGDKKTGTTTLQHLIKTYPKSEEAEKARMRLNT
ncbi:tol-pal system protein YbgF, partial [Candidatus Latescibacterota bacterium]